MQMDPVRRFDAVYVFQECIFHCHFQTFMRARYENISMHVRLNAELVASHTKKHITFMCSGKFENEKHPHKRVIL